MQIPARFYDGLTAQPINALFKLNARGHTSLAAIEDVDRDRDVAHWPVNKLRLLPNGGKQTILSCDDQPPGARLVFAKKEAVQLRETLPGLWRELRRKGWGQARIISLATITLAAIIAVYVFGVPLFARQIVGLVPPQTEIALGARIKQQIEAAWGGTNGLELCDPNTGSLANQAIARFVRQVTDGTETPFPVRVAVVDSDIPNAFALPGGQTYYFSALLKQTESPD